MAISEFTCPHCMYHAPLPYFVNEDDSKMKCMRCRSRFDDPNAYLADITYADCNCLRPVTRFPFALKGENTIIHVRDGYMALIVGAAGVRLWIEEKNCHITNMPDGFQLYFVCLKPNVTWGTDSLEKFGVYGNAQLSISQEYVKEFLYFCLRRL